MAHWISIERARRAIREGSGSGVRVAIIDSGVESSHPELVGCTFVDDLAVVADGHKLRLTHGQGIDVYGHGTAIAGVIGRLAPKVHIGSLRVLGKDNSSRTAIIQRGAQEALDRGYQILNCSFGCAVQAEILKYKDWVDEAYLKGVHVVAACNNEDFNTTEWPACFPSVVAVNMACTENERIFYYRKDTLIEFAAKGVDVRVPWRGGANKVVTGSSFAAPRLTALLARLLSVYPFLTPLEAKAILHKLAAPWDKRISAPN